MAMQWLNEPAEWSDENGRIVIAPGVDTDYWRITHYGFIHNNGPFYYQTVEGNFVAEVKLSADYANLYDQGGLMVRVDDETWIKTGIEFVEGVQNVSAVVTRQFSDWAVVPVPANPPAVWLRLKRENEAVEIFYSFDGEQYQMLRVAYFSESPTIQVGVMACAPISAGFRATFEGFTVRTSE